MLTMSCALSTVCVYLLSQDYTHKHTHTVIQTCKFDVSVFFVFSKSSFLGVMTIKYSHAAHKKASVSYSDHI